MNSTSDTADECPRSTAGETLSAAEYLEEYLKQHGLDQLRLAELTGVSRQTINAIVRGRQPISRAMSARLATLFDQPADFWLREQFRRASRRIDEEHAAAIVDPAVAHTPALGTSKMLTDSEIRRFIDEGRISVSPFEGSNVQSASLDLVLGKVDAMGEMSDAFSEDTGLIEIAPLECAHAWSAETVKLPADMIARVGPMTKYAQLGLLLGHGLQIDPGFHGQLAFTLFNASPKPILVRIGDPVLSLEFVALGTAAADPMSGPRVDAKHKDEADRHFGGSRQSEAVRRHLRSAITTQRTEDGAAYRSSIDGIAMDFEYAAADAAEDAYIRWCMKFIESAALGKLNETSRRQVLERLGQILGSMAVNAGDMDILLADAESVEVDGDLADITTPQKEAVSIPYPTGTNQVSVARLASQGCLNTSVFVIVQCLVSGGRDLSVFGRTH